LVNRSSDLIPVFMDSPSC